MAIQTSDAVANARLDVIETTVGASGKLQLRTGAQPANCAAADAGTLLAEISLPADFWSNAASRAKTLLGTWQVAAVAAGVAAHFRLKNNAGSTCHMQGSVGQGTGDLQLDNTNIANGQTVTITAFTLNEPNA